MVFVALVLSCSSGAPEENPRNAKIKQAIGEYEKLRDEICACEGPNCVDEALEGMTAWTLKWKSLEAPRRAVARIEAMGDEIAACQLRQMEAAAPKRVAGASEDVGQAIEKLEALADTACACEDVPCRKKAFEDLEAWAKQYEDMRGTPADTKRVEELGTKLGECAGRE